MASKSSKKLGIYTSGLLAITVAGLTGPTYAADPVNHLPFGKIPVVYHPVLGKVDGLTSRRKLSDDDYRKMINLAVAREDRLRWATAFDGEENLAARNLCARLVGRTTHDITDMLGQPFTKGGSKLCYPKKVGEDNWLYFFGGTPELIRLKFEGDKCVDASSQNFDQDEIYCQWRADQVREFAVGHNLAQITDFAGEPEELKNTEGLKAHVKDESPRELEKINAADKIYTYAFGRSKSSGSYPTVTILMRDDRCTKAIVTTGTIAASRTTPTAISSMFQLPRR